MPPSRIPSSAGLPLNPMTANYGASAATSRQGSSTPGAAAAAAAAGARRPQQMTLRAGLSSASSASPTTPGDKGNPVEDMVDIEDFRPPEWRTVLSSRADLGYPDFYPSRPGYGQSEDVLTVENVKNGYQAKAFVNLAAESFSMHGPLYKQLREGGLELLNTLGEEIMQKREESMPSIGERSFRIPVRVTYNDTKRVQFLLDLANPEIPLARLMKNPVPHGFKGTELFDTMFSPAASPTGAVSNRTPGPRLSPESIPIDRALWFIRVLGANEITAHRSRTSATTSAPVSAPSPAAAATPSSTNTAQPTPAVPLSSNDWYTIEFTNLFTSWLRNQLAQLILPAPNKTQAKGSATAPAKVPAGVLGDEAARTRWIAKWSYSMTLLQKLHELRLISNRVLLSWLADFLAIANLAQVGLVSKLIGDHLPGMSRHVTIAKTCLRAACERITEIRASPAADSQRDVVALLMSIVTALVKANPEVMLSPNTWSKHGSLIAQLFGLPWPLGSGAGQATIAGKAGADALQTWLDLDRRNRALQFKPTAGESSTSPRRHQMEELHRLDSIAAESNMNDVCRSFFDGPSSPVSANLDIVKLEEKINLILNWTMGLYQLGGHRPYVAYTLLKLWSEARNEYLAGLGRHATVDLFPQLYKWLDQSPAAHKPNNVFAIGCVFGEFTRSGLFSFSRYLQALISHGQTARARPAGPPSHHLTLLKVMPIFVECKDLLHQRKIAICGDDIEARRQLEAEDNRALEMTMEEVKEYIPELFGLKRYGKSAELRDVVGYPLPWTTGTSRHTFLQARFGFFPAIADRIHPRDGSPPMSASTYARAMHLMRANVAFATLGDLIIRTIQDTKDEEILRIVLDTLRRDAVYWTGQDRWPRIIDVLMERHHEWESNGRYQPDLSGFLLELVDQGRLSPEDAAEVRVIAESHKLKKRLAISTSLERKDYLQPLGRVIQSGDVFRSVSLAAKIFEDRHAFDQSDDAWWAKLADLARTSSPYAAKVTEALLGHVDRACDLVGCTVNAVLSGWAASLSATAKIDWIGRRGTSSEGFLLGLVVARRISTVTLLEALVYPVIHHVATVAMASKSRVSNAHQLAVGSAVTYLQQLLLSTPLNPSLPPMTLQEAFIVQTSRTRVLDNAHVPDLIKHLPLLVLISASKGVTASLTEDIHKFLQSFAMTPEFKTAAFRHLELLKDAFLSSHWSKPGLSPAVEEGMVETLKQVMSEGGPRSSTPGMTRLQLGHGVRLSAWRWTSIVLEMRVEFKRLATRIENNDEPVEARESLRKLIQQSLSANMSADEADLLCETFRGIEALALQEILAVGIDRLGALLSTVISAEDRENITVSHKTIDLVLRILSTPTQIEFSDQVAMQSLLAARHRLIDLISIALQAVEREVSDEDEVTDEQQHAASDPAESLSISIKLLKFILGLPIVEPASAITPRPDMARLAASFLRVATHFIDTPELSAEHAGDLLAYILDSGAAVARPAIYSAVVAEAATSTLQSTLATAPELTSALPYTSPPATTVALLGPIISPDGDFEAAVPFDDRPWEMFEKMGPMGRAPSHGYLFLASKPLADTASIPIALFGARLKRDALPDDPLAEHIGAERLDEYTCFSSERNLGDGLAGEPIGARQAATGLFDGSDEFAAHQSAVAPAITSPTRAKTDGATAAPSAGAATARPRRMSNRLASGSVKPSGGATDPITIDFDDDDEDGANDSDSSTSSDEEALGARSAKRRRTASKTNATRPTAAGKRPATSGKAPARATTGGKNVGRKATASKTRRPAGKAPMKGGKRKPSNA